MMSILGYSPWDEFELNAMHANCARVKSTMPSWRPDDLRRQTGRTARGLLTYIASKRFSKTHQMYVHSSWEPRSVGLVRRLQDLLSILEFHTYTVEHGLGGYIDHSYDDEGLAGLHRNDGVTHLWNEATPITCLTCLGIGALPPRRGEAHGFTVRTAMV